MNYVLINANGIKFLLDEKEKNAVYTATANREKMVIIQGQMISLQIIPDVIEFQKWFSQENERLGNQRKRLCKKCLASIAIADSFCVCKEGAKPTNAFGLLPNEIKLKLNQPQNGQLAQPTSLISSSISRNG